MTGTSAQPSAAGTVFWPDEVVARYVAEGYWEGRPLAAHVYAAADAFPDTAALVDGPLRLTYRELVTRVDSAAARLRDLGLRPDDRILVQLPNCWEYVVLTLACLRLGVIPVMALAAHRNHEISHLADHAEVRALVVPDTVRDFDHQAMAHAIARARPTIAHVLVVGDHVAAGSVDVRAMCSPVAEPDRLRREFDLSAPDPRAVALMLLSGGTTGLPKLIGRVHEDYRCQARRLAAVCGFGPRTVNLAVLPFGHGWPLCSMLATLMAGGRVVVGASPAPEHAFATIELESVTTTAVVPAIVQRWLDFRASDSSHQLTTMESLTVGGSRLPDHVAPKVVPTLARTLQQGYGMSEGLVCLTRLDDPEEATWHTQGRPLCDRDEIMIVDEQDQPVAPGEPGMLLTRGPYTIRGYYRAPEHNAASFTPDGWFRTGDIVRQRPDGNLVVEGREKDMINRGGEKISAEEVESFAYQVDGVERAAAVAMPDPVLGERICLYVVARPGSTVTLAAIHATIRDSGVARFKLPERLVLVDALPTSNVGKVDKKALRADIRSRLADAAT